MVKHLSCADMGVSTCTFEARSAVPAEVKDAAELCGHLPLALVVAVGRRRERIDD